MAQEMADGATAATAEARRVISVNAGGPYGSAVLASVQVDSDRVWSEVCASPEFGHWFKAGFSVEARDPNQGPWTLRAVTPEGEPLGPTHAFLRK